MDGGPRMYRLFVVLLVLGAVAVAGCGSQASKVTSEEQLLKDSLQHTTKAIETAEEAQSAQRRGAHD